MFSLICAWTNGRVNNRDAGDLRRHRAHYDVTVMTSPLVNVPQGSILYQTFVALTVYPKKYAHGFCFAVLCCGYTLTDFPISTRLTSLALWQSNDCPSAGVPFLFVRPCHIVPLRVTTGLRSLFNGYRNGDVVARSVWSQDKPRGRLVVRPK